MITVEEALKLIQDNSKSRADKKAMKVSELK